MGETSLAIRGGQLQKETVSFRGHPMVRSLHPTTIEVTTDDHLTARGDCIIGVGAAKGCAQLANSMKVKLRTRGGPVRVRIVVGEIEYVVNAEGDPGLELSNTRDIVIRKSSFLSDRTLAVHADSAAIDLPRPMVRMLTSPLTRGRLEIEAT